MPFLSKVIDGGVGYFFPPLACDQRMRMTFLALLHEDKNFNMTKDLAFIWSMAQNNASHREIQANNSDTQGANAIMTKATANERLKICIFNLKKKISPHAAYAIFNGLWSFCFTVFSIQQQRVISLLSWIKQVN